MQNILNIFVYAIWGYLAISNSLILVKHFSQYNNMRKNPIFILKNDLPKESGRSKWLFLKDPFEYSKKELGELESKKGLYNKIHWSCVWIVFLIASLNSDSFLAILLGVTILAMLMNNYYFKSIVNYSMFRLIHEKSISWCEREIARQKPNENIEPGQEFELNGHPELNFENN